MVLISAFEVPPEADEEFMGGRPRAGAVLYRALRADVEFRFVEVATVEEAIDRGASDFAAHAGRYGVVHEDGEPSGREGVTLINPFEVHAGDDERFLPAWNRARELLALGRGYLGTRLHGSVDEADFRFVNVTRWSSPLMFARATGQPGFADTAAAMPFASHPALYTVVRG